MHLSAAMQHASSSNLVQLDLDLAYVGHSSLDACLQQAAGIYYTNKFRENWYTAQYVCAVKCRRHRSNKEGNSSQKKKVTRDSILFVHGDKMLRLRDVRSYLSPIMHCYANLSEFVQPAILSGRHLDLCDAECY
jgi:hypothetical protein